MLEHGGKLNTMVRQYKIAKDNWLDLSTGLNPHAWPVPDELPKMIWCQLPQDDDGLVETAQTYYQCDSLLAVSGSQAAIQALPHCRPHSRVGLISPSYAEHHYAWHHAGHDIVTLDPLTINDHIDTLDVLLIINPNNPTGQLFAPQQLAEWHQQLAQHGGWLIVDEAFIDVTPEQSLSRKCPQQGLIVLRSIGKFFGLAGLRTGFVLAEAKLLSLLAERLGPWPIAGASRYLTQLALADTHWQTLSRHLLQQQGRRLEELLTYSGFPTIRGCSLFQWVPTSNAEKIHQQLASQGIYTRLFEQPKSLRFGLPKTEHDWQRLEHALHEVSVQ
ncbi:MAG: threonine-phosphate decarboxylase [Methylophaga sp.]|nr:threonine-phosphate decarboxylase [Methylophaga sp.]